MQHHSMLQFCLTFSKLVVSWQLVDCSLMFRQFDLFLFCEAEGGTNKTSTRLSVNDFDEGRVRPRQTIGDLVFAFVCDKNIRIGRSRLCVCQNTGSRLCFV